jgi:hypothetical protein
VQDIVLVGGDNLIPFFRVPDETRISNEADYFTQMNNSGVFNLAAGSAAKTYLGGSTFYRTILTDNYYADRRPTAWRGRGLYLPELGIGRLVETPGDIWHYLRAFETYSEMNDPYTVDASKEKVPSVNLPLNRAGGAFVTGYDFVKDEASEIAGLYQQFGFSPSGQLGTTPTLSSLVNDSWTQNNLTNTWFTNQLPQLVTPYSTVNTFYHLMSINGHFDHHLAIPANGVGGLTAQRLYEPTVVSGAERRSYFIDPSGDGIQLLSFPSTSLGYSIGCHSGLTVINGDIASTAGAYQFDFPSAVLKQGGNWVGNTGFGYGDSDLVAYSEKLAVLFTKALGRNITNTDSTYLGAPLGESLMRAKREYLRQAGPGSFSIYDEKALLEMTLYGLPFIRVKVPNPTPAPYISNFQGSFDPPSQPVDPGVLADLSAARPTFTRLITLTNVVYNEQDLNGDRVPTVDSADILDSFRQGEVLTPTIDTLVAAGKPVVPLLAYDITLNPTDKSGNSGDTRIPQPRGVRLVSATVLPEQSGYNPHITTITTDTTFLQQQSDPNLGVRGRWLPEQPFTYQRSAQGGQFTDRLLMAPAQFWGTTARTGRLRRFAQMVFEVTYIDPQSAPQVMMTDTAPPDIRNVTLQLPSGGFQPIAMQILLNTDISDDGSGVAEAVATYSNDGTTWQELPLKLIAPGKYSVMINAPWGGKNIAIMISATDRAGNVATYTAKGALSAYSFVFMPTARR